VNHGPNPGVHPKRIRKRTHQSAAWGQTHGCKRLSTLGVTIFGAASLAAKCATKKR
jgi:hypothetical protein